MANPRSFSDEDVISAARTLVQQGKNINATNLRSIIKKGRQDVIMATYNRLVEEGAIATQNLPVEEVEVKQYELPSEVQELASILQADFSGMILKINDLANDVAERRLNRAVEEAQSQAKLSIERVAEIEAVAAQAYEEVEDIREELEVCNDALTSANKEIQQLTNDLVTARAKIDSLVSNVSDKEQQIKQLDTDLDSSEAENKRLVTEIAQWELKHNNQLKQIEEAEIEIAALENQAELDQQKLSDQHDKLITLTQNYTTVVNENEKLSNKLIMLEASNQDLNTMLLKAKDDGYLALQAKDKELLSVTQRATIAETQLANAVTENKKLQTEGKKTQAALTKAESQIQKHIQKIDELETLLNQSKEDKQ